MYICVAKEDTFPEHYSDFLVFIYETSADGRTPVGDPIGKGVLPVEEIEEGGLNKPYNIKMTNMEGGAEGWLYLRAGRYSGYSPLSQQRVLPLAHQPAS